MSAFNLLQFVVLVEICEEKFSSTQMRSWKSLERMWVFFDTASSGFLKVSCKVKLEITPRSVCKFFTKFFIHLVYLDVSFTNIIHWSLGKRVHRVFKSSKHRVHFINKFFLNCIYLLCYQLFSEEPLKIWDANHALRVAGRCIFPSSKFGFFLTQRFYCC